MTVKYKNSILLPVLTGLIMLLLVSYWALNQYKLSGRQSLEIMKSESDVIIEAVKGIIQTQMRRHRVNKHVLTFLLNRLIEKTPLTTISIYISDKKLCSLGQHKEYFFHTIKPEAYLLKSNVFYYCKIFNFEKLPPPPKFIAKNNCFKVDWNDDLFKREKQFYNFEGVKSKIIIGLDVSPLKTQIEQQKIKLLIIYIISSIAILAFTMVWLIFLKNARINNELEKAKDRTEKAEELGLAAAGLAHEVKNPLGIIRGFAQQIVKSKQDSDYAVYLAEKIIDETDITAERLSDFINYAKHRATKMEDISIEIEICNILDLLKPEFEERDISVQTGLDETKIMCDTDFFNKILINILLNSLQACSAGDEITIKTLCDTPQFLTLIIHDNGPGIDKDLLPKIFKPYISGRQKGHGIGLAIVKKLCEDMEWQVTVKSDSDFGTETKITNIKISTLSLK